MPIILFIVVRIGANNKISSASLLIKNSSKYIYLRRIIYIGHLLYFHEIVDFYMNEEEDFMLYDISDHIYLTTSSSFIFLFIFYFF